MRQPNSPLKSGTFVFRAIRSSGWKDGATADVAAFYLKIDRPDKPDEEDLSVLTSVESCVLPNQVCADNSNRCYGAFILGVDQIREIGLDVIYTPDQGGPLHASIKHVPKRKGDTKDKADEIANSLADLAKLHHESAWKKSKA